MAYSVKSLSKKWECSERHIYNMISAGTLKTFNIGKRRGTRIADEEVERWEKSKASFTVTGTLSSDEPAAIGLPTSIM